MGTQTTTFQSTRPQLWHGRYARIPGDKSVFHSRYCNGRMVPAVEWDTEDGCATCFALDSDAVRELSDAVQSGKRAAGDHGGGAFVINEFGQVLVPSSRGDGRIFLVGMWNGKLLLDNPFDENDPIDLADCSHLQPGDPWKLPYVGFPFTLNASGQICFRQVVDGQKFSVFPPRQDEELVQTLHRVRGNGGGRFIVNYGGVVLTKTTEGQQIYVGQINFNMWFKKEDDRA